MEHQPDQRSSPVMEFQSPASSPSDNDPFIDHAIRDQLAVALRAIRTHLGMTVAFVSEFCDGRRVFRYVDSTSGNPPIRVGQSEPLDETYCQRVVDGRLPELIRDAARVPAARALPVTASFPIGAHLSVPIRLGDGSVYGTFCCFSESPNPALKARDLAMMRVFAEFAGQQIEQHRSRYQDRAVVRRRVQTIIDDAAFEMVYQPILDLKRRQTIGFEALSRFSGLPDQSPDLWFKEALSVGLSEELETLVVERALTDLAQIPEDCYLTVNVSPEHILSGCIVPVLARVPLERIVLEVTEYETITDYASFAAAITDLRAAGLRLAVDDTGAGYASFRHVLKLQPDIIKLDMSLTRSIDAHANERALAAALIRFAEETGITLIAEGVETEAELGALERLGVNLVQGYLIGRPQRLELALAAARR